MKTASQIANYLVTKCVQEGEPLTNKRLQKLLYYIQAWSLAINEKPMFEDKIEAWIHGPAIRSVYEEYKSYVANPITKAANPDLNVSLGKDTENFIQRILSAYSKYDTATLEVMTHAEEPWQKARKDLESSESSSNEISHESMRTYYAARLAGV